LNDLSEIDAQPLTMQILASGDDAALRSLGFSDSASSLRCLYDLVVSDGTSDLPANLLRFFADAPDPDVALSNFERLSAAVPSKPDFFRFLDERPVPCQSLVVVLGSSQYLSDILARDPGYFTWLFGAPGKWGQVQERDYYDREIENVLVPGETADLRLDGMRRLGRRELLRIGAADLAGSRPIHRVADELSDLADSVLERVITECKSELQSRYGAPKRSDGSDAEFAIIGLGKLGGQELNFSSDIDLMFVYSGDGVTDVSDPAARSVSNQEYFTKLSERIVHVVSESTSEGFFYRVDMRLRPDGAAGALTMPLGAYEAYYARRGELWERQMLIKARPIAGSSRLGDRFMKMIQPFVFPGHTDGRPVEEIHRIKQRIEGKIGRSGTSETHLKLRSGGIRDIEFVVQCLQLIVGQVHKQVRSGHTLEAIEQLRLVGALTDVQASALSDAYLFFRRLEHRLQMMHGLSDYSLPDKDETQRPMSRSMGFDSVEAYQGELDRHLSGVQAVYGEVFSDSEDAGASRSVANLCEIDLGDAEAEQTLADIGFAEPAPAHRNLVYLAFGHAPRIRGTQARRSFMELAPALIDSLIETVDPDQALSHFDRLVSAYGAGNTLFQTLNENPFLRELLLKLCAGSEFLVGIVVRNPGLLDWLILPSVLLREREESELDDELDNLLSSTLPKQKIAALNGFKNRELLRIGTRDLLDLTDSFATFEALTLLAECILKRVYAIGCERLEEKAGLPRTADGEVCPFVILGLGKMGGRELNFGSDLDLIFVYGEDGQTDKGRGNLQYFVELCQSIVNDFEKLTPSGRLYGADARLRPEGGSALLAISYDTYCAYLKSRAKTWERMALSRSRTVAGDVSLGRRMLEQFETFVVADGFGSDAAAEIRDIRKRMEMKDLSSLSIKTAPGGIVDVEFLVQILQLRHAAEHPEIRSPSTHLGLGLLMDASLLTKEEAAGLAENFVFLRTVEKTLRRQNETGTTRLPSDERGIGAMARAVGFDDSEAFVSALKEKMTWNREIFDRYV
jgi:glutamate-ammonia-ligase adenylyltransferase